MAKSQVFEPDPPGRQSLACPIYKATAETSAIEGTPARTGTQASAEAPATVWMQVRAWTPASVWWEPEGEK